jgi:hypothetical protein
MLRLLFVAVPFFVYVCLVMSTFFIFPMLWHSFPSVFCLSSVIEDAYIVIFMPLIVHASFPLCSCTVFPPVCVRFMFQHYLAVFKDFMLLHTISYYSLTDSQHKKIQGVHSSIFVLFRVLLS